MGAVYAVAPLDEEAKRWLRGQNIAFPEAPTRWPTSNELRSTLESFSGYSVSYSDTPNGGRDAEIVETERGRSGGCMANLWVKGASTPDAPAQFSFHKPSLELALTILGKLSHFCGPFLLMDGSSGNCVVVSVGADVGGLSARIHGP